jgi:hypothetical protein
LQLCYNNDTKTEERQKNAEQTKEEESTSKKVHEEQEIAQRTQIKSGIDCAKVSDQSSLYSQMIQDERNKSDKRLCLRCAWFYAYTHFSHSWNLDSA